MSDSTRSSNQSRKKRRSPDGDRRSRTDIKRRRLDDGSAQAGRVSPDDEQLTAKQEALLRRQFQIWKLEQAKATCKMMRKRHFIRLRDDLTTKFIMIPDEGQFERREDERFYYESYAFAYEELLRAMFPNDLGFHVDRQIMPTGAGVFHCRIQNIPMFFGEIKPGRHANRTQDRYDADCEIRERLLDLVGYLRRNFEQKTRPDRVYAVSALGLQVRFYHADVGGDVGDPITIQPPPRPSYSQATCSGKDQYDYWRLSILDTLSVNTLKTICENVHKSAERVRSATVPHSDEAAAVEVFHGKYLMVRDFERLGLPVPEVGGCYGRVDLYTLIEDMETYRDAPPATKTAKRDKEYDDDLSSDPEATKVWRWRHKLQKVFLNSKAIPKEEEMPEMDELFSTLENYPNMTMQYLLFSKIGKVMRHISVLPYEKVPRDDEFKFQERAKVLLDKWYDIFVKTNGASDSAKPATDGTRKAADAEEPTVNGAETEVNGTKAEPDVKPDVKLDVMIKDQSAAPANGAADESVIAGVHGGHPFPPPGTFLARSR